jgi:hypothetical protein
MCGQYGRHSGNILNGEGKNIDVFRAPGQLLVCGKAILDEPLIELLNGAQVLNTGERVLVLMAI